MNIMRARPGHVSYVVFVIASLMVVFDVDAVGCRELDLSIEIAGQIEGKARFITRGQRRNVIEIPENARILCFHGRIELFEYSVAESCLCQHRECSIRGQPLDKAKTMPAVENDLYLFRTESRLLGARRADRSDEPQYDFCTSMSESEKVDHLLPVSPIELGEWDNAILIGRCLSLPSDFKFNRERIYVARIGDVAPIGGISEQYVVLDIKAARIPGRLDAPRLSPVKERLMGACGPHSALRFQSSAPDDVVFRWEVQNLDGSRVLGPYLSREPAVSSITTKTSTDLREGAEYVLVATAINSLGEISKPARIRFKMEMSCRDWWKFWSSLPAC